MTIGRFFAVLLGLSSRKISGPVLLATIAAVIGGDWLGIISPVQAEPVPSNETPQVNLEASSNSDEISGLLASATTVSPADGAIRLLQDAPAPAESMDGRGTIAQQPGAPEPQGRTISVQVAPANSPIPNKATPVEAPAVPSGVPEPAQPSTQTISVQQPVPANPAVNSSGTAPSSPHSPVASPQAVPAVMPTAQAGVTDLRILSPTTGTVLDVPSAAVILQIPLNMRVEMRVNGQVVNENLVGRTETDGAANRVIQIWYGLPLIVGENQIEAIGTATNGTLVRSTITVNVRGGATQMQIQASPSRLPADGRSSTTIQGVLLDSQGNRANEDGIITLTPSSGEFIGTDAKSDIPGFQVIARQGQFTATLRSSITSGTATVRATVNQLEAFTQVQYDTSLRPSIMTGVVDFRIGARGTDYYRSFREFLPADLNYNNQVDFYSAAFATGGVGEWLITAAYNTARGLNQDCLGNNRLFRDVQFCQQIYPVYGDSSTVDTATPSLDSIFFRIERTSPIPGAGVDFGMWGDYRTEELATRSQQFTSITRQLHGLKFNYNLGNLQVTGLFANNVQGFQRDVIAADGTSGLYFLSQRLLVPGSETVAIELEELLRPGSIVARQELNRGVDYDIDYDRGTLSFRRPLLRTDLGSNGEILARRIVASYQVDQQSGGNTLYAGRLRYHLSRTLNLESWIGATYLKENQGVRGFELYGADALFSFGPGTNLVLEYARSNNSSEVMNQVGGSAGRADFNAQIGPGMTARAYYRFAETGFANNATVSFVPGQTRYGAQFNAQISPDTQLRLQVDRETNRGTAPQPTTNLANLLTPTSVTPSSFVDNGLTTITAGFQQKFGAVLLDMDFLYRDRQDRIAANFNSTSSQLRSRLTVPFSPDVTFRLQNELTLSSGQDVVFPDSTILALDWKVFPGIELQLAQRFITGGQFAGSSITGLSLVAEQKITEDTVLRGRYSVLGGSNNMTTQGAIGLNHRWAIAPGLNLNLSYERIFGDFLGVTASGQQQFLQPFATGQTASTLGVPAGENYSIGLEYLDNPGFQASTRFERRTSSSGSNTVLTAAITGKITPALTALFRFQQTGTANQLLTPLGDTVNLRLGLAFRDPLSDSLNVLLRYEYRQNPNTIPTNIFLGSGTGSNDHTFALEAIYAPVWQWEFYGKLAWRGSTSYLASDLVGTSSVTLAQLRTVYRAGFNTELVAEARWVGQPGAGYSETGYVLEAAYYLTPNLRLAAGFSGGSINADRDFSGTRAGNGFYAGLTFKLNELFEGFGLQKVAPPQQQESTVQAAAPIAPDTQAQPLTPGTAPTTAPTASQALAQPVTPSAAQAAATGLQATAATPPPNLLLQGHKIEYSARTGQWVLTRPANLATAEATIPLLHILGGPK